MLCFIHHPDTWKLMSRYWKKTLLKYFCWQQEEPTDYWSAVLSRMYNEVFPKSVHIPGIPLLYQLICMVCGRKCSGVKCKVCANINTKINTWLHYQHFPRCWCWISCCMLRSRERAVMLQRICSNICLLWKHIVSVSQVYTYCIKSIYQVKRKQSLISA